MYISLDKWEYISFQGQNPLEPQSAFIYITQ